MGFVRLIGYTAGVPVLLYNIGMSKFKSENTGRGTPMGKGVFQKFISKKISYKKVLSL
jgi:hypothetical protein